MPEWIRQSCGRMAITMERQVSGTLSQGKAIQKEKEKMSERPVTWTAFYHSPARLLATLVVSIYVAEAAVMTVIHFLRPLSYPVEVLLDSTSLVLLLSPIFYYSLFRPLLLHITERRRTEEALRKSEEQIRHLSLRILTVQEAEKRRISRELHDELGQALTLTKLRLRSIEQNLREDQAAMKEEFAATFEYIDQIIKNVRRLALDLSPSTLDRLGLTETLRSLLTNLSEAYGTIKVTHDIMPIDHLFSKDAWIIIYRILQEALTNIAKHAEAEHVVVAVEEHGDRVSLIIEDDGRGFDVHRLGMHGPAESGLGSAIISERVRMLKGILDLWSEEGKGTRMTIDIPVEMAS